MRNSFFAILSIGLVILSACGREVTTHRMNETQAMAMEQIQNVPLSQSDSDEASGEGLVQALQMAVDSGQVNVSGAARGAVSMGNVDVNTLVTLLSSLQNGGGGLGGVISAATNITNSAGSSTAASSKLSSILALLQAAAPIIATIAPQYAGIINALVVIIPMVVTFINMFKKPKTALILNWTPTFA